MTTFTQLALTSFDPNQPFTDGLRLAVAACPLRADRHPDRGDLAGDQGGHRTAGQRASLIVPLMSLLAQ